MRDVTNLYNKLFTAEDGIYLFVYDAVPQNHIYFEDPYQALEQPETTYL
jgi:hypothetical protein